MKHQKFREANIQQERKKTYNIFCEWGGGYITPMEFFSAKSTYAEKVLKLYYVQPNFGSNKKL